jgi:integrase
MARKTGSLTQRGEASWRIGYDGEAGADGKRKQVRVTFHGSRKEAEKKLRELLTAKDKGTDVDPSRLTIAEYLGLWLANPEGLSPKTSERYRQLVRLQINPHLGHVKLQQLRPNQVADWLTKLGKTGISARTIGHARRVLHTGFERALRREEVSRNVVSVIAAPKVDDVEIEICQDVPGLLSRIAASKVAGVRTLHNIAAAALATGARRGELLGLAWTAVDLDKATVRVERSLEETAAGLRFKTPKTKAGKRTIAIPPQTVELLRAHRLAQREAYLKAMIRPAEELVFARPDGAPLSPDNLSRDWKRANLGVSFHALRHTHASALIAAGVDVATVSRRLGHANVATTLRVYTHVFDKVRSDDQSRDAIARVLG